MPELVTFFSFDGTAEAAANYYVSLFPGARLVEVQRWGEGGPVPAGTVLTASIDIAGRRVVCLNTGPQFAYGMSVSLAIMCRSQEEVDHYYDSFAEGGREHACGWVTDRYGITWQVTPTVLPELLASRDPAVVQRTMAAMMTMRKLDVAAIEAAGAGVASEA